MYIDLLVEIARPKSCARVGLVSAVLGFHLFFIASADAQNAQADLSQGRNGTAASPRSPVEWVRGNAGAANSHYVEGYSVPYRLVLSGLSTGIHRVVIEWDTRAMGKHALDYLTSYERLEPHNQFGAHVAPEAVQPLDGLAGTFSAPSYFALPVPSTVASPVTGEPAQEFQALAPEHRRLTIWNGRIVSASMVQEQSLEQVSASSQVAFELEPEAGATNVVVAWGGHIASKLLWGSGHSASQISGSSYHMRIISVDGSGGNQDRSLQAIAVVSPPTNAISGPVEICPGVSHRFQANTDGGVGTGFVWLLTNNAASASFVGPTNAATVDVMAGGPGTFTLMAVAVSGTAQAMALRPVSVLTPVTLEPLSGQMVCPGGAATFSAIAGGTGPLTYIWKKDGEVLPGQTEPSLSLRDITRADAGMYCVEVTGACGHESRCAALQVEPPLVLACSDEVVRPCVVDLPAPDPSGVSVVSGKAPVTVVHGGDVAHQEEGDVIVLRTYLGTDACGQTASCVQRLIVRDRTAPLVGQMVDLVLSEEPEGSGQAKVAYATPPATDTCDPAPVVECVPPSDAILPLGNTRVVCVARDSAGNTNDVSFQVRVVPRTIRVNSLADSGPGTLREALEDANAASGANTIAFAFSGAAPYVIQLLSPLPAIREELVVDGWSQLTFAGVPVVGVNGGTIPAEAGQLVAGLTLISGGNVVRGVVLYGFDIGLRIEGPGQNVITGNIIGSDHTGTNAIGNTRDGILLTGGTAKNVIGPDNIIAFNGGNGVTLDPTAGSGNAIFGNRIVFNAGLPIDLGDDGATANDPSDPDDGPNGLQNSPKLQDVRSDGFTKTTVQGKLMGRPGTTYTLEFSLQLFGTGDDPRQAQRILGIGAVTTDEAGDGEFSITLPEGTRAGQWVTATATDPGRSTSEMGLAVPVRTPPIILVQPEGLQLALGASGGLCVTATGTEPLAYQWRRNGANIPGATNSCFLISHAAVEDGGSYTVVVANELDAISSERAEVVLELLALPWGDDYATRLPILGSSGLTTGTNAGATREVGEPQHSAKPGGHSIWYSWVAPADGIATFSTTGSTFDTLLGIYLGNSLTNLEVMAEDEDRGGYFTSQARFNAVGGLEYQIALDGFGAASGHFVLRWQLDVTPAVLPIITNQPVSQTVVPGATAVFTVGAAASCHDAHHDCRHPDKDHHQQHEDEVVPVFFQWYLNNVPIANATNSSFSVANAGEPDLGKYTVRVREGTNLVESAVADLQLNLTGPGSIPARSKDKFLDALNADAQFRLGSPGQIIPASSDGSFQPASLARGYTGTQVFNTSGSLSEGEVVCGVVGGSSEWLSFVAEENGTLFLNTDGSSFDTVLAVYRRSPTNATRLELINCDNNSGIDHRDSALQIPVQAGRTNFIVVDGVNGAVGTLRLNYALVTPSALSLSVPGLSTPQAGRVRVTGHAAMRFTLEASTNLVNWLPLFTTNSSSSIFEFADPESLRGPRRFYRAIMLP